ncbi:hypothetical protein MMYC01_209834 [Madurella mycetomatis]|uniref:Rhodopsin domain-containing protein n=1 Tax=Madurella mycetomatis TaxID=100816 RepID=A0A175VQT5_9PEZI|nr:hypothetical protein MMYC01_209834 [Madurella mycetomatis]
MMRGPKSLSLLGWIISFVTLCSVTIVVRFWSARIQKRKLYGDDFLVLIAHISMLAMAGVAIWGLANGLGNTATELSVDELKVQAQVLVGASVTWAVSTTVVKMAVLWLYTRIFDTLIFKRIAYGLFAVCACYGISFLVVFITHCSPVSQEWDPVPWGTCNDLTKSQLASNSINAILDIAIVVLPMPPLWSLKMALRKKVVVMTMFGFGFATVAVMFYRIYATVHADPDPILALADVGLLSFIELWLGIIVACLPTMAPVFKVYVEPALSKASSSIWGQPSNPSSQQLAVNTIGGSGPATGGRKFRSNYTELSLTSTVDFSQTANIPLVPPTDARMWTHCSPSGAVQVAPPGQRGVYVQHQFHAQGTQGTGCGTERS